MKKLWLIYFTIILLSLVFVRGEEIKLNIDVTPNEIWVGNSTTISCWYSGDNIDDSLSPPSAYISHLGVPFRKNISLTQNGIYYNYTYSPPNDELGTYQVFCSNGTFNSSEVSFIQNNLSLTIIDSPEIVYQGGTIEKIHVKILQTGDAEKIITEISPDKFKVFLNEEEIEIDKDGSWPSGNEWIIVTKELSDRIGPSNYNLIVEANFKGKDVSDSIGIEIKNPFQFNLVNIGKTQIKVDDNITLTIQSSYKGERIDLSEYDIFNIKIGDENRDFSLLSEWWINTEIMIKAPNLSPGEYDLNITAKYKDPNNPVLYHIKTITKKVNYLVPVSGNITNGDGEGVNAQIDFYKNDELIDHVDTSSGSYSRDIGSGIYDIDIKFTNSQLILSGVDIKENFYDNSDKE